MPNKTMLASKRQALLGIALSLAVSPAFAQYVNQGFQYQSPPALGGPYTLLAIAPGQDVYPAGAGVWVYGSYVYSQLNGTRLVAEDTLYFNENDYASLTRMQANSSAVSASVEQMVLDSVGNQYYLTSEYSQQYTPDGAPYFGLIGHYLHINGQVLSLSNQPVRLTLDGTGCSTKVFVLESDANHKAYVEGFTLKPGCGPWYGSVSLSGETPVDIAAIGGKLAVLGNRSLSCQFFGSSFTGSGGAVYLVDENLGPGSAGTPDFTPCRSDNNFLALKGFATGPGDGIPVDGSNRFYVYGDILATSGQGHLAYYFGMHSAASMAGFIDGGFYPTPVSPPPPPPASESVSHRLRQRASPSTTPPSLGNSTGAVLADSSGTVYITGTANASGSTAAVRTVKFSPAGNFPPNAIPFTHSNPYSGGIALDNLEHVYVATGGYSASSAAYVLAFESFGTSTNFTLVDSGQWATAAQMAPTVILLRRFATIPSPHRPDVFLGGSILYPDSQHMYTGVATEFRFQ